MNYFLENDSLKVTISDLGAELTSIYGKTTDFEYLWQGDAKYWKSRATNVFPICGRLYQGKYTYNGNTYELGCHGFAKLFTFTANKFSSEKIEFVLNANEETKKVYPFDFTLKITYALNGAKLTTEYTVINTGNGDLPFSIGGHPGFNIPLAEGVDFSEHYVEFEKECKPTVQVFTENLLYSGNDVPFPLEKDKILRLKHSLFDDDAKFLNDTSKSLTLKSDKAKRFVKVTFDDFNHVGFWHAMKTQAPFVCIEPWNGVPAIDYTPDDFATKKEFIHLDGGKTYTAKFDIEVNE